MEPMIPDNQCFKPMPRETMCQKLKGFCKEPYCYVGLAILCILILILGFTGNYLYEAHKETQKQNSTTIVTRQNSSNYQANTTTQPSATMGLADTTKMPEININKIGQLWVIVNAEAGLVSLEPANCRQCPKITLNSTQIDELHSFLVRCNEQCPIDQWPSQPGQCNVCNILIKMRTSDLHLCLGNNNEVTCGFIYNYTLNYIVLELLFASQTILTQK